MAKQTGNEANPNGKTLSWLSQGEQPRHPLQQERQTRNQPNRRQDAPRHGAAHGGRAGQGLGQGAQRHRGGQHAG